MLHMYREGSKADDVTDDVRDIYRRAEGHELQVEGLRDGQGLVAEE